MYSIYHRLCSTTPPSPHTSTPTRASTYGGGQASESTGQSKHQNNIQVRVQCDRFSYPFARVVSEWRHHHPTTKSGNPTWLMLARQTTTTTTAELSAYCREPSRASVHFWVSHREQRRRRRTTTTARTRIAKKQHTFNGAGTTRNSRKGARRDQSPRVVVWVFFLFLVFIEISSTCFNGSFAEDLLKVVGVIVTEFSHPGLQDQTGFKTHKEHRCFRQVAISCVAVDVRVSSEAVFDWRNKKKL